MINNVRIISENLIAVVEGHACFLKTLTYNTETSDTASTSRGVYFSRDGKRSLTLLDIINNLETCCCRWPRQASSYHLWGTRKDEKDAKLLDMTDFEVSGHNLYIMYGAIHEILELKVFMFLWRKLLFGTRSICYSNILGENMANVSHQNT